MEIWQEDVMVRGHFEDPVVDGRCMNWIMEEKVTTELNDFFQFIIGTSDGLL